LLIGRPVPPIPLFATRALGCAYRKVASPRACCGSLGGSIHDPTDPVGRLLFSVLAMVAEFESDLIRLRTREGMKVAKAKGRLRGKQPKLKPNQEHLLELHNSGELHPS
jgi:hypothetical protein